MWGIVLTDAAVIQIDQVMVEIRQNAVQPQLGSNDDFFAYVYP